MRRQKEQKNIEEDMKILALGTVWVAVMVLWLWNDMVEQVNAPLYPTSRSGKCYIYEFNGNKIRVCPLNPSKAVRSQ